MNGERLVIPVISGAMNIDVGVNSSPRHGDWISGKKFGITLCYFWPKRWQWSWRPQPGCPAYSPEMLNLVFFWFLFSLFLINFIYLYGFVFLRNCTKSPQCLSKKGKKKKSFQMPKIKNFKKEINQPLNFFSHIVFYSFSFYSDKLFFFL